MKIILGLGLGLYRSLSSSPPPAPPFAPSDIADLVLWLDASDTTTMTQVGGSVSEWRDKSGNAQHATQPTSAQQPAWGLRTLNTLNGLDFDGTDDWMDLPDTAIPYAAGTDFIVYIPDNTTRTYLVANSAVSPPASNGRRYIQNQQVNYGSGNRAITATSGNAILQLSTISGNGSPQTQYINVNGTTASGSVSRNGVSSGMNIGSVNDGQLGFFDGVIFEYLNYSRVLSNAEINDIGNYLKNKWGLTWTNI